MCKVFALLCWISIALANRAVLFDARRADVISFPWISQPVSDITLQFWSRTVNAGIDGNTVLSYGTYDGTVDPIYNSPYEIFVLAAPAYGFYMAKSLATTFVCKAACRFTSSNWNHYTIMWSGSGDVRFYINATLIRNFTDHAIDNTKPLVPNGIVYIGQGLQEFPTNFGAVRKLDAILDEYRIYTRALTLTEIQDNYARSLSPDETLDAELVLYLKFDQTMDSGMTLVNSAMGRNRIIAPIRMGRVDGTVQKIVYSATSLPVSPTRPRLILSGIALGGNQTVTVIANTTWIVPVTGLVASSTNETLIPVGGALTAGTSVGFDGSEMFITTEDGVAVSIVAVDDIAPTNISWEIEENKQSVLYLGHITQQNVAVQTVILSLPTNGTLSADGIDILFTPYIITTPIGTIRFTPFAYQHSDAQIYDSFDYTFTNATVNASVLIFVHHVNSPPVMVNQSLSQTIFNLTANDPDGDSPLYYRLVTSPKWGTLQEVGSSASLMVPSSVTFSYAVQVINASSQFSLCSDPQCVYPWKCNCTTTSYHATQILGAPDLYPLSGDLAEGWDPDNNQYETEFIELGLSSNMVVESINIYETFTPGAVFRISFASETSPDQWITYWQRREGAVRERVAASSRDFSPPLCPRADVVSRLRLDLVHAGIVSGIDAVKVTGYMSRPLGLLSSSHLNYTLHQGLLLSSPEQLEFVVSDCQGWSVSHGTISLLPTGRPTQPWQELVLFGLNMRAGSVINMSEVCANILPNVTSVRLVDSPDPRQWTIPELVDNVTLPLLFTLIPHKIVQDPIVLSVILSANVSQVNYLVALRFVPVCPSGYLLHNTSSCVPAATEASLVWLQILSGLIVVYTVIASIGTLVTLGYQRYNYAAPSVPWMFYVLPNVGFLVMVCPYISFIARTDAATYYISHVMRWLPWLVAFCLSIGMYAFEGLHFIVLSQAFTTGREIVKGPHSSISSETAGLYAQLNRYRVVMRALVPGAVISALVWIGVGAAIQENIGILLLVFIGVHYLLVLLVAKFCWGRKFAGTTLRLQFLLLTPILFGVYITLLLIQPSTPVADLLIDSICWVWLAVFQWKYMSKTVSVWSSSIRAKEEDAVILTMSEILTSERYYTIFYTFAASEFSAENVVAWREIQTFKMNTSVENLGKFIQRFIREDAPLKINMPSHIVNQTQAYYNAVMGNSIFSDSSSTLKPGTPRSDQAILAMLESSGLETRDAQQLASQLSLQDFKLVSDLQLLTEEDLERLLQDFSIKLKAQARAILKRHISGATANHHKLQQCLNDVEQELELLIKTNTYPRFLQSEEYIMMVSGGAVGVTSMMSQNASPSSQQKNLRVRTESRTIEMLPSSPTIHRGSDEPEVYVT